MAKAGASPSPLKVAEMPEMEAKEQEQEPQAESPEPASPLMLMPPPSTGRTAPLSRMSRMAALLAEAAKPESDEEDEPAPVSAEALAAALRPVQEEPAPEAEPAAEQAMEAVPEEAKAEAGAEPEADAAHDAACAAVGCASCRSAGCPRSPLAAHLSFGMLSPTECIFSPSRRAEGAAAASAILSPKRLADLPEFSALLEEAAAEAGRGCGEQEGPCEVIEVDGVPVRISGSLSSTVSESLFNNKTTPHPQSARAPPCRSGAPSAGPRVCEV